MKNNKSNITKVSLTPEISRFEFVGRDEEISSIKNIICKQGLHILNIFGPGGIGKTSLLQKIQGEYNLDPKYHITDIIDFYDLYTSMYWGFMDRLVSVMPDYAEPFFQTYHKALYRAEQIELSGITGGILQEEMDKVFAAFVECMNRFTSETRCIVLMDTFEESAPEFHQWFIKLIKGIKNIVFITAGRKNETWDDLLKKNYKEIPFTSIELKPFTIDNSEKLVRLSDYGKNISIEELKKLQILSDGFPILLILAVDKKWPKSMPGGSSPQKESTFTSEKYSISDIQEMSDYQLKKIKNEFRNELINGVHNMINLQGHAVVIMLMAHLSRYFTQEMFEYFESVNTERAQAILEDLKTWTFMKHDFKTNSFRLHDLIRELIIKNIWPSVDHTGEKKRRLSEKAVQFYENRLLFHVIKQQQELILQQKQLRITADNDDNNHEYRIQEIRLSKKIKELRNNKRIFQAQGIYYQIIADYDIGIEAYQLLFEYNLWLKDTQANELLKRELQVAMADSNREYPLCLYNLDAARENIIINRKFDEAVETLNQVSINLHHHRSNYLNALILLYKGIAWGFKNETDKAEENTKIAIAKFKELEKEIQYQNDSDNFYVTGIKRSLTRASGGLGFIYLMTGNLDKAIESYKNALRYSKIGNMPPERSYHLNDLGYAYACLGQYDRASFFCKEGLKIREELSSEYLCGLSYNTLGLIEYMADSPEAGIAWCEKSLSIFKKLGDARGTGLAHRALGGIFSRIADRENSIDNLKRAKQHLLKALDIFIQSGIPLEPVYMAETYLRMGMMYKTWYRIAKSQEAKEEILKEYFLRARFSFQRCIKEFENANSDSRLANAIGRLADLYIDIGDIDAAELEVQKIEDVIKKCDCDLSNMLERIIIEIKIKCREFLHPIARLYFLKARLNFYKSLDKGTESLLKSAARNFVIAYAFMANFSENAFDIDLIIDQISTCLNNLNKEFKINFIDEIKIIRNQYPETDFTKLFNRLDDAEMV
ncbi:p-loop and tetratricopeptide domains-containing [Desulfonema limicola]|uniref:P-loop and tetratricopeptide domains-containing n=1 Tax=Desulfonema limicola TaxID=45656 RepID=A0A975B470_9BACT|nr:tetratricopeptide repeat protein [Desulfonema limicola]QTA78466.1 p-loop and tetratricopeptide domains-containing [Desulfonema limicola]